MSDISDFVKAPSEDFLKKCTKEQLLKIAEHFEIDISDRRLKDTVKSILTANLTEMGVLAVECPPDAGVSPPFNAASNFTFEQQKEVLKLQLEHDKLRQVEIEQQLAIERLRFQTEQAKLQLQQYRLDLMKSGKSFGDGSFEADASSGFLGSSERFDVLGNLKLLPKFSEKDPETFFSLFERVAETRKWPESSLSLMLQCALTGRAQEAYSAMSAADSQNYCLVKAAVLKAYELVPEAYRQRFRTWKKTDNQTHLEFARDLIGHFTRWCSALKVNTFDGLCDLLLLEQFKNSIPENIAQHIGDHKVKTVNEAAALADDYVLTHRRSFGEARTHGASSGERVGAVTYVPVGKPDFKEHNTRKSDKTCNYCHKKGHFKADCFALKAKTRQGGPAGQPKGACLAVSVPKTHSVQVESVNEHVKGVPGELESFLPFVSDGHVSLVGSDFKVPVKILRDTAAFDSFIQASVLPFSEESHTGCFVPVLGMGMKVLQVPLHKMMLYSDLFQGQISVGVRPALPIEGITVILGNGVAGGRVWADAPPPPAPVVSSVPLVRKQPDEYQASFPEVFTACAVTRSMARDTPDSVSEPVKTKGEVSDSLYFSLSDVPLSASQEELKSEQRADSSLEGLFDMVLPEDEVKNNSHGYFLLNELLVRKWVPHGDDFVGDPIIQIVVPVKFRESVLKLAHDESGHWGVKKTYNRVLRHFFWPRLKRDVVSHIKTCHTCQLTGKPNQSIKPAPLLPIPAVSQPFEHLIIDCVGPILALVQVLCIC